MILHPKIAKQFANEHVPYRLQLLETALVGCMFRSKGEERNLLPLVCGQWNLGAETKGVFFNMCAEIALVQCRVLLNFLGIYKQQKERLLQSRAPQQNFRDSEVWIERFPGGRLLSTKDLCRAPILNLTPRSVRAKIVDTLDAASRGVAHLTVPKKGSIQRSKLKFEPLLTTGLAARYQVREHFYRRTLRMEPPGGPEFETLFWKAFQVRV